jgi:flagellar FliJ protein
MAFRFRYEALLSYRRHMKEKAEIEFSEARRRLREARESLRRLRGESGRISEDFRASLIRGIPSQELKDRTEYWERLKERLNQGALEISAREREAQEKKETLLKRTKDLKTIERLKEKDLENWLARERLLEQKRLNEIAVMRHGKEYLP